MSAQVLQETPQVSTDAPAGPASQGRLRAAWRRVRATVAEMNYGARRFAGLNATVNR